MTDLLAIGGTSVRNSQIALSVVSNNIANVNTEGYVRQELNLQEGLPTREGLFYVGGGALADGVRRSYDGQIESSLRISASDLRSQGPLIENTQRLINVFGNKSASLSPALGSFFDSLRALSVDASSEILRDQVLNEGQTLASRFNGLAQELNSLEDETMRMTQALVSDFNALSDQLAIINNKLQKTVDINKQSPALLDSRDQVLRQMSQIARVSVNEAVNGMVTVNIGPSTGTTKVVDASESTHIGVNFVAGELFRTEVLLDPINDAVNVSGVLGGELGGLITFREQMLAGSIADLDNIASTLMTEMNSIQSRGMDMNEQPGKPFFASNPVFSFDYGQAKGSASPVVSVFDSAPENLNALNVLYDANTNQWVGEDLENGQRVFSQGSPPVLAMNGLSISFSGQPRNGDVITITSQLRPALTLTMGLANTQELAAGDLFRVSRAITNTGEVNSSVSLDTGFVPADKVPSLSEVLVNNPNSASGLTVSASHSLAKTIVKNGTEDLALTMSKSANSSAELQVFTRDGRHLFGSALGAAQRSVMMTEANGFVPKSSYSDVYLNGSADYMDNDWSYGARAESISSDPGDGVQVLRAEAILQGGPLPSITNSTSSTQAVIAAGALNLNGVAMTALELPPDESMTPTRVLEWLNQNIDDNNLPMTAAAVNEIRVTPSQLSLDSGSLTINNYEIHDATPIASTTELVNAINARMDETFVEAHIDFDGAVILRGVAGHESASITFGSDSAVFTAVSGEVQAGIAITATREEGDTSDRIIELNLSTNGSATDLAKLGLKAELNLPGELDEDLIVFTTGNLGDTATLSAGYSIGEVDPLKLRESVLEIEFSSPTRYQINDAATGTILADRSYSDGDEIRFRGLKITLEGAPQSGDIFTVDNNEGGFGSNENVQRMVNLESAKLVGNNDTLQESYLDLINRAGSTLRQAQVTQEALQVVFDQATEARDQVAGVNLDEEAANLIRFQQAYQASARLIQTANQLFDIISRL